MVCAGLQPCAAVTSCTVAAVPPVTRHLTRYDAKPLLGLRWPPEHEAGRPAADRGGPVPDAGLAPALHGQGRRIPDPGDAYLRPGDEFLGRDSVFGVKDSLVMDFALVSRGEDVSGCHRQGLCVRVLDGVLAQTT